MGTSPCLNARHTDAIPSSKSDGDMEARNDVLESQPANRLSNSLWRTRTRTTRALRHAVGAYLADTQEGRLIRG